MIPLPFVPTRRPEFDDKSNDQINDRWRILTLKSFDIPSAKVLKLKFFWPLGLVGLPSVSTIITLGLSGLSPPAGVNSSSLAIISARSVRVSSSSFIGSLAIFANSASLLWYSELEKVNTKLALLWNVMKPKWSPSGAGWNLPISSPRKRRTFFRLEFLTLFDLSKTIPTSSPAVHGGAEETKGEELLRISLFIGTYMYRNISWLHHLGCLESSKYR